MFCLDKAIDTSAMEELYRGVRITPGIVCFDIVYFIDSEFFRFFGTEDEAKKYIDECIYMDLANKWLKENEKQLVGVEFSKEVLLEIGKNIDNITMVKEGEQSNEK